MNDNYYQNKLDDNARDHDEAPPQAMTRERAQALVDAHERGQLMSDRLLAEALVTLHFNADKREHVRAFDDDEYDGWEDYQEYLSDVEDTH